MIDSTSPAASKRRRSMSLHLRTVDAIYRDLVEGKITVRTTLADLCVRYGSNPWRCYKDALRDYGYERGCLVMTDDENHGSYVAMMEHFGREITPKEASAYFFPRLAQYRERKRIREVGSSFDNIVLLHQPKPTRYSVYRLPFGDYSTDTSAFFEERGEFIWQTYA